MSLKKRIRENIALAGLVDAYGSKSFSREWNLRRLNRRMTEIDSIADIESFKDVIDEMQRKQYAYNCASSRYEDVNWYGYYQALECFSGYPHRRYPVLTEIEHGIRFGEAHWPYFDYNTCYVCEGKERIREIPEEDPWMPVVAVGPFIHYATQYYSEKKIQEERNRNGKTLLVFPGHSTEWVEETRKNEYIDGLFARYAGQFQTILVCSYWRDLDSEDVRRFREHGAKIVSAGFRGDVNFIRRLKTIISLADLVVGNDIGTNMGFCLYLKKPFILEGACQVVPEDPLFTAYYRELYEAFSLQGKDVFSEEQLRKQREIYERFWGESLLKTPKEIYGIFALIDKLIRKTGWSPEKYRKLVRKAVKSGDVLTTGERKLLLEMLPGIDENQERREPAG